LDEPVLTVNQRLAAEHVSKLSVAVAKPEVTGKPGQKNAFGRAVDALGSSHGSEAIVRGSLIFQVRLSNRRSGLAIILEAETGIER